MNATETRKYIYLILLCTIFISGCASEKITFIEHTNKQIKYVGRMNNNNSLNAKEIYWSGSSIKINFEGTSVSAIMQDERADNFYNVIIDDKLVDVICPDSIKTEYKLCDLENGKHTLELFKRTEWDRGKSWFYGFKLNDKTKLTAKPKVYNRKIEFYGNSITCGYGIEDFSGQDRSDSIYTNNYLTYAALTARHYNAEYHCTSRSGIGIMISWFPVIMPEIYDRINPLDENSVWDFGKYQADIVLINLFQNDSWLVNMPDHESFKLRFANGKPSEDFIIAAYKNFVNNIRSKYPSANIVCALGSMDITREGSKWPEYIREAVSQINDVKIYTHFMPYKNTPGHPKVDEQKVMSESLINFIDENIEW
ncbi:MAG: hypothetical protein JEY94_01245 [Melioribacteraceae bacterium]|nr:hypothetical protein [Melioribacteraceae bacterium]